MSTTVLSEPILAHAASLKMSQPEKKWNCVNNLIPAFSRCSIDAGDSCGMVGVMVLLFTMDSMNPTTSSLSLKPVKVRQFFIALLGEDHAKQIEEQTKRNEELVKAWNNGELYFNHFARPMMEDNHSLQNQYPKSTVEEAYCRAAAVFFPENFPGADIGIPVN